MLVVVVVVVAATTGVVVVVVVVYRQRTGGKCNKFIPLSFLVNYSALCDVCIVDNLDQEDHDSRPHRLRQRL